MPGFQWTMMWVGWVRFGLPASAPGLQLPLARFFFSPQLASTSAYRVLIGCWSMMTDIPYYYHCRRRNTISNHHACGSDLSVVAVGVWWGLWRRSYWGSWAGLELSFGFHALKYLHCSLSLCNYAIP
jgi:hypothetical protein